MSVVLFSLHWRTCPRCAPLLLWVGFVTGLVTPTSSMSAHYLGLSSSSPGPLFLPMLRGSVGGLRASYARLVALDLASARSWPDACRGVSTETPHLHSCCVCLTRWEAAGAACGLRRKKSSLLFSSPPQHNFSLLCFPRACAQKKSAPPSSSCAFLSPNRCLGRSAPDLPRRRQPPPR